MAHVEENGIALDRLTAQQIEDGILRAVPGGEIDAALRNKVSLDGNVIRSGLTGGTLGGGCASIVGTKDGAYFEAFTSLGEYTKRSQLILFSPHEGGPHVNIAQTFDGQTWTSSALATATKPDEHDLPLAAGVTRGKRCVYSKAQDGLVVVRFSAKFPAATSRSQAIGTLPVGYRPIEATSGAGKVGHASGDTASATDVELWENGVLTVYGNTTGFTNASGMVVFYAT